MIEARVTVKGMESVVLELDPEPEAELFVIPVDPWP